jgi:TPR repeat protein
MLTLSKKSCAFAAIGLSSAAALSVAALPSAQASDRNTSELMCMIAGGGLADDINNGVDLPQNEIDWIVDYRDVGDLKSCLSPPRRGVLRFIAMLGQNSSAEDVANVDAAVAWLKKTQPSPDFVPMAFELITGKHGGKAPRAAVALLEWGVEIDDPAAIYELAGLYDAGALGFSKNSAKAMKLEEQAAGLGHATSMYALGVRYYNGQMVKRSTKKADDWFGQAAEHGNTDAVWMLAQLYSGSDRAKQLGFKANAKEGAQYAQLAAQEGNTQAMVLLASYMLKDRKGGDNEKEVFYWLNKASDAGDKTATNVLNQFGPKLRANYAEYREIKARPRPPLFSCKPVTRCLVYRNPGVAGSQKICAPAPNYRSCSLNRR